MIYIATIKDGRVRAVRGDSLETGENLASDQVIAPNRDVINMAYVNGEFVSDAEHQAFLNPPKQPSKVPVTDFKLLFTSAERVAIKQSTDPTVQDFYDLIQDPRVQNVDTSIQSVQDAVMYLEAVALILGAGRAQEILDACKR